MAKGDCLHVGDTPSVAFGGSRLKAHRVETHRPIGRWVSRIRCVVYVRAVTRLAQDLTTRRVHELPDFDGPPEHDILLIELCERECTCNERCKHADVQLGRPHVGNLMKIETSVWNKRREAILKEMWSAFPDMSDIDIMQSVRNQYVEDAGVCFNRHQRPSDGCIDYKEDHKRIGSPSKHPWLAHKKPVYLCDFCPVKSTVQGKVFHKRGLYQ